AHRNPDGPGGLNVLLLAVGAARAPRHSAGFRRLVADTAQAQALRGPGDLARTGPDSHAWPFALAAAHPRGATDARPGRARGRCRPPASDRARRVVVRDDHARPGRLG